MNELLSRLGMKEISPFFDECYEKRNGVSRLADRGLLAGCGGFLHELGGLIPF